MKARTLTIQEQSCLPIIIGEIEFIQSSMKCGVDIYCIYQEILKSKIYSLSEGIWIWDVKNNLEIYCDKFINSLGHTRDTFPNKPESWQKWIFPEDLELALDNYKKVCDTNGGHDYSQYVRYNHFNQSDVVRVICHGIPIFWQKKGLPHIMLGMHLKPNQVLDI